MRQRVRRGRTERPRDPSRCAVRSRHGGHGAHPSRGLRVCPWSNPARSSEVASSSLRTGVRPVSADPRHGAGALPPGRPASRRPEGSALSHTSFRAAPGRAVTGPARCRVRGIPPVGRPGADFPGPRHRPVLRRPVPAAARRRTPAGGPRATPDSRVRSPGTVPPTATALQERDVESLSLRPCARRCRHAWSGAPTKGGGDECGPLRSQGAECVARQLHRSGREPWVAHPMLRVTRKTRRSARFTGVRRTPRRRPTPDEASGRSDEAVCGPWAAPPVTVWSRA